jgi:L-rhamnose mutarotase
MERLCFIFTVREGQEDEYDRRHQEMWPELIVLIRASGMTNYTIFRRDRLVVGYAECMPTIAATQRPELDPDGIGSRWATAMADVLEQTTDGLPSATEVWHLA